MAWAAQGGGGVTVAGGVALRDMVSRHGGGGLAIGLDDLMVFSKLNDSMIL